MKIFLKSKLKDPEKVINYVIYSLRTIQEQYKFSFTQNDLHYFHDTDGLIVTLNKNKIVETDEFLENVLLDLDSSNNLVGIEWLSVSHTAKKKENATYLSI